MLWDTFMQRCEGSLQRKIENTNKMNVKTAHVYGLEELVLSKCSYYQMEFICSIQYQSKYQKHSSKN